MSKISVITVVKNDGGNILKTVRSVLNQKNVNFEYLIMDGMSSDSTSNKLRLLSKKNIIYVRQRDKNLYDAINTGVKIASGDYIFLIHSGDIFYNDFVLNKIQKKLHQNPDIIYGNLKYYIIKNNTIHIKRIWKQRIKKITKFNVFKIPHTTIIIKKEILNKLNHYNTEFSISSDMDFMIRLSQLKKINLIYLNTYFILMLHDGLSTSKTNFLKKFLQDIKVLYKFYNHKIFIFYFFKIYFKFFDLIFFKKNEKH